MNYSSKYFLETKKLGTLTIENNTQLNLSNLKLATLVCKGGACFNKLVAFKEGFILGNTNEHIEGNIRYFDKNFYGYNGTKWIAFTNDPIWEKSENNVIINNKKIGIGKLNPKKLLDIAGDVQIDKKLHCNDMASFEQGICLRGNKVKKMEGVIRYSDNTFQGYNGKNWINFGLSEEKVLQIDGSNKIMTEDTIHFNNIKINNLFIESETVNSEPMELNLKSENNTENLIIDLKNQNNSVKIFGKLEIIDGIRINKKRIENIDDPENDTDVVTKRYVDNLLKGLKSQIVVDLFLNENNEIEDDNEMSLLYFENKNLILLNNGERKIIEEYPLKVLINHGEFSGKEIIFYLDDSNVLYHVSNHITQNNFSKIFEIGNGNIINLKLSENLWSNANNEIDLRNASISHHHLQQNIIKSENIEDGSINCDKIIDSCVTGDKISNETIGNEHLKLNIINGIHLQENIVQSKHIVPNGISEKNLCPDIIDSIHLKPESILISHLSKECITSCNIKDNVIQNSHLTDKCITSDNIAEESIISNHLSEASILKYHLSDDCIQNNNIVNKAIDERVLAENIINANHIKGGEIRSNHLGKKCILSSHIKDNQITTNHIEEGAISSNEIKENSIESIHIVDQSISSAKLSKNIITKEHLCKGSVTSDHLAKSSITANHLGRNIIEDIHLNNFIIKTNNLAMGCVTEQKIQEESISNRKIKDNAIQNNKLRTPYLKLEFDKFITGNSQINLGETLKIGINNNYYLPKKEGDEILINENIKIGEEDCNKVLNINNDTNFLGKVNFVNNNILPVGSIINFLKDAKIDNRKYIKLDGRKINKDDYSQLFEILNSNETSYILPDIRNENYDSYLVV
jgi:hypothetical protein